MPPSRLWSRTGSPGIAPILPWMRHIGGAPARRCRSLLLLSSILRSHLSISGIVLVLGFRRHRGRLVEQLGELLRVLDVVQGLVEGDRALLHQLVQALLHEPHALFDAD